MSMSITPEIILASAVAAAVVIAGLLIRRATARRTRNVGRPLVGGPASLRFKCATCSQQFTHSRRTLAAWEKGARQFHCNACHTKWQGTRSLRRSSRGANSAVRTRAQPDRRRTGSGCLGTALLLIAIPAALIIALLDRAA